MTHVLALIGANALYLTYAWLLSAVVASWLSDVKGYGEKPGLASGLLLNAAGVVIWILVPARPYSRWTLAPAREGGGTVPVPNTKVVGRRAAAFLIDAVVLLPITVPVNLLFSQGVAIVVNLTVSVIYWGALDGVVGQTVGKRVMKIRVINENGTFPVGFGKAGVRYSAWIVDGALVIAPGLLLAIFTRRNRRLGDMAAGTLVVAAVGEESVEESHAPRTVAEARAQAEHQPQT
jgi:uncharacterized RDD family membrane protein YckC